MNLSGSLAGLRDQTITAARTGATALILFSFSSQVSAFAVQANTPGTPSNGIALVIASSSAGLSTESSDNDTATFSSKQPIYLRVGIENLGSAAVGIAPALGTLSLRVTNLNGSPVQRYPCPISDTGAEKFNPFIGSGQVRWDPLPYPFTCFEYKMSPGTYIVTATANIYAATKQYPYGTPNAAIYATPVSNSITLSIQ